MINKKRIWQQITLELLYERILKDHYPKAKILDVKYDANQEILLVKLDDGYEIPEGGCIPERCESAMKDIPMMEDQS